MVARLTPTPVGFCAWPGHAQNRGGQGRNRTSDTRIFSPLLYQLSYLAGPVRPGSECGKGARIIRGIRPLAKNTRRGCSRPASPTRRITSLERQQREEGSGSRDGAVCGKAGGATTAPPEGSNYVRTAWALSEIQMRL